jgi:hypothetical protein
MRAYVHATRMAGYCPPKQGIDEKGNDLDREVKKGKKSRPKENR